MGKDLNYILCSVCKDNFDLEDIYLYFRVDCRHIHLFSRYISKIYTYWYISLSFGRRTLIPEIMEISLFKSKKYSNFNI